MTQLTAVIAICFIKNRNCHRTVIEPTSAVRQMQTAVLLLIFASTLIHATWNVWMRHLKGNTPVFVFAHLLGSFIFLPFTPNIIAPLTELLAIPNGVCCLVLSTFFHSLYLVLLSAAYIFGDVGLVYPLARGTSIILATLASQVLSIGDPLTSLQLLGIAVVVIGVWSLCIDAITTNKNKFEPSNDEVNKVDVDAGTTYLPAATSEHGFSAHGECDLDGGIEQSVNRRDQNYSETDKSNDHDSPLGQSSTDLNEQDSIVYNNSNNDNGRRLKLSILLAALVGSCTATYSVLDSIGVEYYMQSQVWSFYCNAIGSTSLLPIMFVYYKEETKEARSMHKRSILLISPMVVGAYMIILYAFSIPGSNVAMVVAFREFAILIGAFLGVVILKEPISVAKFVSILVIVSGFVLLKVA